jgi:hypothetical protein
MAVRRVGGAVSYLSIGTGDTVDRMQVFANRAVLLLVSSSSSISGVKLPNGGQADLGTKLEDYSLNPLHRDGRHKARVFRSALGITQANAGFLRSALEEAAAASVNAVHRGANSFGEIYELRLSTYDHAGHRDSPERMDRSPE